jgi:hypothetical protein
MDTPTAKSLTKKERKEMIRTHPAAFLRRFGNHISNAELDACVIYTEHPDNKAQAPRAASTAAQLIPKRLKEKHWEEITQKHYVELLFNCPAENIPRKYHSVLLEKHPTLALINLAERLERETLLHILEKESRVVRKLLRNPEGTYAGYKLAKRIIEEPELDINPETRKIAFQYIAATI